MQPRTHRFSRIERELVSNSLRAGHDVRLAVAGSSMVPTLWPGDQVVVNARRVPSREDLVLFIRDGRLCTHRLVDEISDSNTRRLITQGDTALKCDPPMSLDQILGSVVNILRDGREIPVSLLRRRRLLSLAIRHSEFIRRVIFKLHVLRRANR